MQGVLNPICCDAQGGILLPETPNSLIERGHLEEARRVLKKIRGTDNIEVEYEDIVMAQQAAALITSNPYKTLFSRQYRPQLVITILVRKPEVTRLVFKA